MNPTKAFLESYQHSAGHPLYVLTTNRGLAYDAIALRTGHDFDSRHKDLVRVTDNPLLLGRRLSQIHLVGELLPLRTHQLLAQRIASGHIQRAVYGI